MKRDPLIDGLRGAFHILILIDHLPILLPCMFGLAGGIFEPLGFFSAAEGFVFLSGYMTGFVYVRLKRKAGSVSVWRKCIARAITIYFCYIAAVVFLLVLVKIGGEASIVWGDWRRLIRSDLFKSVADAASLRYQPYMLDILPMYAMFLLISPWVINQLDRGRDGLVAFISIAMWTAEQFGFRDHALKLLLAHTEVNFGFFSSFAWQVLFIAGMLCGHKTWTTAGHWLPRGWVLATIAYLIAFLFFTLHNGICAIEIVPEWVQRSTLGPLRLVNFGCVVFLIARFRERIESLFDIRCLALLSKHSLQVFAFHLVPIYLASRLFGGGEQSSRWIQLCIIGFCLAGLFQIAWLSHVLKDGISRGSRNALTIKKMAAHRFGVAEMPEPGRENSISR